MFIANTNNICGSMWKYFKFKSEFSQRRRKNKENKLKGAYKI